MKVIKYLTILIMIILIIIEVCGCSMVKHNTNDSEQQIVSGMEEHLSSKYGNIEYDIEEFIGAGWDHPYDVLNLSTMVDGIKEPFCVERHENDGEYVYLDNYFGLIVRNDFELMVGECAAGYFPEFKVFAGMQSNKYPNFLTKDSSFEDFLAIKDELCNIIFIVIVNESFENVEKFNEAAELFVSDWASNEITSIPRVIYLSNDIYETITREYYRDILVNNRITEYSEVIR